MEIHIQLAGVQLGPYSEKQVRDYLAEGLLSEADPARFDGTETWESVKDILAKNSAARVAPPAPPVPEPAPPAEARRTSSITKSTNSIPLPRTSRETIRIPLPQLKKAIAGHTSQAVKATAAENAKAAMDAAKVAAAEAAAVKSTAPLPAKPSDLARTSLLSAVKILAKKPEKEIVEEAPAVIEAPKASTVPIALPRTVESSFTMPLNVAKKISSKILDPEDRPMPVPPATAAKKSDMDPQALDPKRTSLLSAPKLPASPGAKAEPEKKPVPGPKPVAIKLSDTPRTETVKAPAPAEGGVPQPPAPVRIMARKSAPEQKPAPATETPSSQRASPFSSASIPSPKSPQTLRTAPMSAVRALPKKQEPEVKPVPEPAPENAEAAAEPVPAAVRFTAKDTEALKEVEPTDFAKKALKRTTGPLPSLVKAMEKKTGPIPAVSDVPGPDSAEPATVPEETPETSPETKGGIGSWFKSLFGSRKSAEPVVPEEAPETAPEAMSEVSEKTDAPKLTEDGPGMAAKTVPIQRRGAVLKKSPDAAVKEPAPEQAEAKASTPPEKALANAAQLQTKPDESAANESAGRLEPLGKLPAATQGKVPLKETTRLKKLPQLAPASVEPAGKLIPLTRLPPEPVKALPKSTDTEAFTEVPEHERGDRRPLPKKKSGPSALVIIAMVILLLAGGLGAGAYFYVQASYQAGDALLKALRNGDQARLAQSVDFPAIRKALEDEVTAQIDNDAHTSGGVSAEAAVAMFKNSIEYYITPETISALVTNKLPKPPEGPALKPELAASILAGFNKLPVASQNLVTYDHLIIDLDAAKLGLQFDTGSWTWKLNRIELKSNFQLPQEPGAPAAPQQLGQSLVAPVIETYFEEGKAKFQQSDWDASIAAFDQVLNIDPKQVIAYSNRGMAKRMKGDLDGAIADFTQAISLEPKLAEAYDNRGDAKKDKKDIDGAIADYTQAIQLDPKMAAPYYNRGTIRVTKNDYEGAIADLTQGIELDPTHPDGYVNRGFVRQAQKDLDGAIADYTQALAIDPKIAAAYYNRGLAKQAKADLDGALSDYNHALDLDPKMTRAYYSRGIAKNTKNDLDGAIADYNQALALDPKLAPTLTDRALAKQAKGDLKGALDDFNAALAIDPKIGAAYYSRGLIKEQMNDLDGAITDSSRSLDLDPKRAQAYYNRGFAKLVKGNLEGARNDLQKFCDLASKDPYADHARLYLWLIAMAQNPNGTANQDLSDALQNNWSLAPDDLVSKIANFLLDRTTEADLLTAANSTTPKIDSGQHCEVWYFIGMKRLLAGDRVSAVDDFRKCMATGQKDYCEYILANAEMQILAPTQ
jgi:tetratricopeptide (TPR) repeat protein